MVKKLPKFNIRQTVFIIYPNNIKKKKVTAVIEKENGEFCYFLNHDTSYFYYEDKLYGSKECAKKEAIQIATKEYNEKIKSIKG